MVKALKKSINLNTQVKQVDRIFWFLKIHSVKCEAKWHKMPEVVKPSKANFVCVMISTWFQQLAYEKPCKVSHRLAAPGVNVILYHHRFDVNVEGQMAYGFFLARDHGTRKQDMLWKNVAKMRQSMNTGSIEISLFAICVGAFVCLCVSWCQGWDRMGFSIGNYINPPTLHDCLLWLDGASYYVVPKALPEIKTD